MTWARSAASPAKTKRQRAEGGRVEDRPGRGYPEGDEPERECEGGDEDRGGGEHEPGQHRDVARDAAGKDRLEPPGLLLTPGHEGDEADAEQGEEEGSEEAELVLDDAAETVDALDPAVDRDEGLPGGDGLGVAVDLLGGPVEAGDRPRRADHAWR